MWDWRWARRYRLAGRQEPRRQSNRRVEIAKRDHVFAIGALEQIVTELLTVCCVHKHCLVLAWKLAKRIDLGPEVGSFFENS